MDLSSSYEAREDVAVSPSDVGGELVVVAATDDRAAMALGTMLYSAAVNYRGSWRVTPHILATGTTPRQRARIEAVLRPFSWHPVWLFPNRSVFDHLPIAGHVTRATYFRLLIPDLLPRKYEKALYLDADMVVLGDIGELWEIDVSRHPVFAVQDEQAPLVSSHLGLLNYRELGLPEEMQYFNCGVLLMNLNLWRSRDIGRRVIDYLRTNGKRSRWWDQDGLNAVLAGDWGRLDPRWNRFAAILEKEALAEPVPPAIVHFVGSSKPWTERSNHWTRAIFEQYLGSSGWFGWFGWRTYLATAGLRRGLYRILRRVAPVEVRAAIKRAIRYRVPV